MLHVILESALHKIYGQDSVWALKKVDFVDLAVATNVYQVFSSLTKANQIRVFQGV